MAVDTRIATITLATNIPFVKVNFGMFPFSKATSRCRRNKLLISNHFKTEICSRCNPVIAK
jgi:hypothetical protein